MGEEASCNAAVSAMDAAVSAKPPAKTENGCVAAEDVAAVVAQEDAAPAPAPAPVAAADPRLQGISDAIRVVPHFPKQGVCLSRPLCSFLFD